MASTSSNWRVPKSSSSDSLEWRTVPTKVAVPKKPAPATLVTTPTKIGTKKSVPKKSVPKKSVPKKISKKTGPIREQFWRPVTWQIPFYRCQACKEVMSRKDPSKTPQMIYSCKHITCAKCIVSSFFVELNPLCPVKDCDVCVNPRCSTSTPSIDILPLQSPIPLQLPTDTYDNITTTNTSNSEDILPIKLDDLKSVLDSILQPDNTIIPPEEREFHDEDCNCSCYDEYYKEYEARLAEEEQEEEEEEEEDSRFPLHYCGHKSCIGDCGILSCGCIDICRNYRHRHTYEDYRYCYE
jgi:hypothetical protein